MHPLGKKYRLIAVLDLCDFRLRTNILVFTLCTVFKAVGSDYALRSAFGCRKLIREMLHGPEVWICRLQFNSCISLCAGRKEQLSGVQCGPY